MRMHYQITKYEIPVASGTGQRGRLRAALLCDLHNNLYPGLPEILEREKPDLILVAGDMVNAPGKPGGKPQFGRAYALLKTLAERYPVYYAPGNHEGKWSNLPDARVPYERYRRSLSRRGIVFLENTAVPWEKNGIRLELMGLDLPKVCYRHKRGALKAPDPELLFSLLGKPVPKSAAASVRSAAAAKTGREAEPSAEAPYRVLLAHTPLFFEPYLNLEPKLVLSGHLHGGMIRLPFLGGLVGPGFRFFPPFSKGIFRRGGARMIVSAGLGTHGMPFRPLNPRQLVFVDLVKE